MRDDTMSLSADEFQKHLTTRQAESQLTESLSTLNGIAL
jgi:hypothetical protein